MSNEETEKKLSKVEETSRPQSLKTESVVSAQQVEDAEKLRTDRFESMRKMPVLQPGMTVEQAKELESKIDSFGIDFGGEVLTSNGLEAKNNYASDKTSVPESRSKQIFDLKTEREEAAQPVSSNFPIEQAIWKAFRPQDAPLSDQQVVLLREVVVQSAKQFADNSHKNVDEFIDKNKKEVAVALAGTLIKGALFLEAAKDGVAGSATGAGPAAAISVAALLKFIVEQAKVSPGNFQTPPIDGPNLSETKPDAQTPPAWKDSIARRFDRLEKTVRDFSENPAQSVEDFFTRAEAWNVIENNIVSRPTTLLMKEHTIRLVEQMESMHPIDLIEAGKDTRFVFPEQLANVNDVASLPSDLRDIAFRQISGSNMSNEYANGLTVFSEEAQKQFIFVPALVRDSSGALTENAVALGTIYHEMGHILLSKNGWLQDVEVRRGLHDGQQKLLGDLQAIDRKLEMNQPLTIREAQISGLADYVRVNDRVPADQRLPLMQHGQEEALCDLFSISCGFSGLPPAADQLLLEYFGPVKDHLERNNWNRPSGQIGWLRKLTGGVSND